MAVNSALDPATEPAALSETGLLGERLTAGDFVTAAWNIYRQRFKLYCRISLQANLWLLVPVYGWGKFCAGLGAIARLAFNEATNRPEPPADTRRIAAARQWDIFLAGFLTALLMAGINLVASVTSFILTFLGTALVSALGDGVLSGLISLLFLVGGQLGLTIVGYWFYARFFLVELPLVASSERSDPTEAIGRSWQITRASGWSIVMTIFAGALILTPLFGAILVPILVLASVLVAAAIALGEASSGLAALTSVAILVMVFATILGLGTVLMPLWQTLKGLIYADLCDRREGLGLMLACQERRERRSHLAEES